MCYTGRDKAILPCRQLQPATAVLMQRAQISLFVIIKYLEGAGRLQQHLIPIPPHSRLFLHTDHIYHIAHICLLLGSLLILAGSGAFLLTFRELNNQPSPPAPGIAFLLAAAAILCYTVRRWRQGC